MRAGLVLRLRSTVQAVVLTTVTSTTVSHVTILETSTSTDMKIVTANATATTTVSTVV